jgi:mannose-6-phosphate isomerase-like protein (cupin superfamily)
MTKAKIKKLRRELRHAYPGAHIVITPDGGELIAEIRPGFAVAVIERSRQHFHRKTAETYRGLKGVLHVVIGCKGHVLQAGESVAIEPGTVHFSQAPAEPAWIEVFSKPAWTGADHLIVGA